MQRIRPSFLFIALMMGALPPACGGTSDGDGSKANGGTAGAPSGAGGAATSGGNSGAGGATGGSAQGGNAGATSGGATTGGGGATGLDCDHRKITCRRAEPECPMMQVPRVDGTCYGECVPIGDCGCTTAEACPHEESYVCHRSAMRCGPYVN